MLSDSDKEKAALYLSVIDTLWRYSSCECTAENCVCSKAREVVKKVVGKLEKVVITEEEE